MITSISLSNFKSFSQTAAFNLNDMLVIVGPNSSGKTSLIQALLLLAQTLESQRQDVALDLGGRHVQFSEFRDIVFGRPLNYLSVFGVRFNLVIKDTDPLALLQHEVDGTAGTTDLFADLSLRRRLVLRAPENLRVERKAEVAVGFGATKSGKPVVHDLLLEKTYDGFLTLKQFIERTGRGRFRVTQTLIPERHEGQLSVEKVLERVRLIESLSTSDSSEIVTRQKINPNLFGQRTNLNTLIQAVLRYYGVDWLKPPELLMPIRREIDSLKLPSIRTWSEQIRRESVDLARDIILLLSSERIENSLTLPLLLEHFFPSLSSIRGYDPKVDDYLTNFQNVFEDTVREVRRYLRSLEYLGPLRARPERVYLPAGTPPDIGKAGENAVPILWLEQNIKVLTKTRPGQAPTRKRLDRAVQDWFEEFGVAQSFHITKPKRVIYQAELEGPVGSKTRVTIADVGFGVSQLLPVIVAGLRANESTTLIFEQPEIHLHPRLQAKLADFFICLIELGKYVIVETHSEHLINMLRLRIVQDESGELQKRIGILFVQSYDRVKEKHDSTKDNKGSFVENLEVDQYGQIVNWPEGFFSEHGDLNESILNAMMARHQRGNI